MGERMKKYKAERLFDDLSKQKHGVIVEQCEGDNSEIYIATKYKGKKTIQNLLDIAENYECELEIIKDRIYFREMKK